MSKTSSSPMAAIILAAGKGTRMLSRLPKVMHEIGHLPMLGHVLKSAKDAGLSPIVVVAAPEMEDVAALAKTHGAEVAHQHEQLGTGHAVRMAEGALKDFKGHLMVLYGDTPLLAAGTISKLRRTLDADARTGAVVLGFDAEDPAAYGRLKLDDEVHLERIIEARDASEDELAITLCNSGIMALRGSVAWSVLADIKNTNAKKEYYLTDAIALMNDQGMQCRVVMGEEEEVLGVNSRSELAQAEAIFQFRMRRSMLENGVTLRDPDSVFFAHDTTIAPDVIIEPNVVFYAGVRVGAGSIIRAFSYLEDCNVGKHCVVGPFARIRPHSMLADRVKIGNFVEVKNAEIAEGAKLNHLSYVGDATVGKDANIGAGTITCNYDGVNKYRTIIGEGAFIGSNSALVAPVSIGDRAIIAAGSVITEDVSAGALALARNRQSEKPGWAAEFKKQGKKN